MRTLYKHTKAFTMIELVFVIVVLGILAALALPRMERDLRQEAADNILSAIRYTQHLALNDDKTDPFVTNWQQKLWMIKFTGGSNAYYTISSDIDISGSVNKAESAIDPANGKYMYNSSGSFSSIGSDESPNIFLGNKYGIDSISMSGGCSSQHIAFDHLGRPFNGLKTTSLGTLATNDYSKYMPSDCNIVFGFVDGSNDLIIRITKETGHAFIAGQESL
ncbi:prepilin-type N-terminal cleavage/methylation domain-containing protein [Sulfurovum sp.]|uniref:pilus assembly FimT family protein n=1 Tax=Sulfurovum sp. TaxID=1969726 RepID=UPI002867E077|nr:prepilin-type N-terminal cleavage/methylation domain-containing protein [Sulfurovum sp.]